MAPSKIGPALSTQEMLGLIANDLAAVEREIGLESVSSVDVATCINKYLQESGGKRLRPVLVLLSAGLLGGVNDQTIRLAAVVEMIHTATLVHDDVIDHSQQRRGRKSVNAVWGNEVTVLAGDWLYMQAFQIALRERNFHLLDLLLNLTQMMVEGELMQLEWIGSPTVHEADHMALVDRKTASLFAACAKLGAFSAGATEEVEERLGEFAWNLGIAFQLVDDLLDFTAVEAALGKPVGGDLREGKATLPVIYALEAATASERQQIESVIADRGYTRVDFPSVLAIMERTGGLARTRERIGSFARRAQQILSEFPAGPYQRALASVVEIVTDRDR